MLLDEPIASLDIKNQIEIMQTLSELNRQEGVSVLMVLHDINLAGIYCDRLIMLKDGQVIAAGNTNDVFEDCGSAKHVAIWYQNKYLK